MANESLSVLWQEWYVKAAVVLSLLLQWLLLVLGTFRKRTANNTSLSYLIHGIYLLSTKVAFTAFYLIVGARVFAINKMPFGLWAAVMALHLAGQERLTAFSLEDNNRWRNSTLKIMLQILVHLGLFFPLRELPLPTWIMLLLAVWRIVCRGYRLRMGTKEMMLSFQFPPTPPQIPVNNVAGDVSEELLNALILLESSYQNLLAEVEPTSTYKNQVRQFFNGIPNPEQAIRLAEIELNFMYESFHTDGAIRKHLNHSNSLMYTFLRSIESVFCIAALAFYIAGSSAHIRSTKISQADNNVTNLLLWGTVFLESFSYVMTVFSDWTIGALKGSRYGSTIGRYLYYLVPQRRRWWSAANYKTYVDAPGWVKFVRNVFRRWSETIYKFNFVRYSIQTSPPGMILAWYLWLREFCTGTQNVATRRKFVHKEWYTDGLGEYIFNQLNVTRTDIITTMKAKWPENDSYRADVLAWHIATELMLETDDDDQLEQSPHRLYSKLLSDYMTYLLFMKPQFFTQSWRNFLKETKVVGSYINAKAPSKQYLTPEQRLGICCQEILNGNNIVVAHWNDDLNVRRLSDAVSTVNSYLATKNMELIWLELSQKWVELLLYAANTHDNFEHVKGLCQGGELVSIVWILAFHLNIIKK